MHIDIQHSVYKINPNKHIVILLMSPLTLRLFAILLIAAAIGTINSAPYALMTITQAQYEAIQIDWTRTPVTTAVGNPGSNLSKSTLVRKGVYQERNWCNSRPSYS